MAAQFYRINYKSDFVLTINSDAGWAVPFCVKFWTGMPSQAYFAGFDGENYVNCRVGETPTQLLVMFDDHHMPIGELKMQIAYHTTIEEFPDRKFDEVTNPTNVTVDIDGTEYQVMLDFTGETAPEIEFNLPAYANEAQRIANEEQRIANEDQRISNEEQRIANEEQRISAESIRIANEESRISEFAQLKHDAEIATADANAAATLANEKAALAAEKAALAAEKAALSQAAAELANAKATLAQQKADYAQTQGDYAKAQGDYAKEQGNIAEADHERAESDHTRAESDHAAVEVYVDSLGAFDISAYHATGDVLAKYVDLSAALDGGNNIPEAIRKGGMSVKFVQSSDNKYVQYFLTKNEWSASEADWEKMNLEEELTELAGNGSYTTSEGWIRVVTDADNKILYGVKNDGEFVFGVGVPQSIKDYVLSQKAEVDADVLAERTRAMAAESDLSTAISNEVERATGVENSKVDKEEGKSLIDAKYASSQSAIDSSEYLQVTTDSEYRILEGIKQDGTKFIGGDLEVLGNMEVSGVSYRVVDNSEYIAAWVDADDKIVFGLKSDGKTFIGDADFLNDIKNNQEAISEIQSCLSDIDWDALSSITATENPLYIEAKTDSEGRLLAGRTPDGAAFENVGFSTPKASVDGHTLENVEDPEGRIEAVTDSEDKVISYRDGDGVIHEKVGIVTKKLDFIDNDSLNVFRDTILPSCTTVKEAVETKMTGLIQVGENVVVGLHTLDPSYSVKDIEEAYRNILPNPKFPFIKKVSLHRLYDDAATPNMLYMCSQSDSHIFYSICPTDTKRAFGTVDPDYYTKYTANYFYYADKETPNVLHKVVLPVSYTKRIKFVFEMSNGDCLVEIENGSPVSGMSVASYNNIYVIKGVFSGTTIQESDITFSLTFDYWLSKISSFDNIVEYKAGHIVLAPYSGGRSAKVYISHDYGATWDLIFCSDPENTHFIKPKAEHFGDTNAYGEYPTSDLLNPKGELDWSATVNGNVHIHGIAYDRWYDRIWIVTGDGGAQQDHNVTGIWWTDDEGYTWRRIGGGKEIGTQLIGIVPMEHCVLFPTDGGGNGFWRWSRNGKDSIIKIELCYNYTDVGGLAVYGGRSTIAKNGFHLTTFAPENYTVQGWSNLGGVVATYNGYDFEKIYEDSFGEGTYETAEIGCCCPIADCEDKIILGAYYGGYIELDY